ncbi:hypothetical protein EMIHUDRAFT_211256 [Emiliania huxleyi CCMP1516]|uniref:Chromo domain-containing protein n=2 Tax=Emiliania huxleyi TaxID=2903 RepID=A0A0D3IWP9_EMIH1|nr:hypothetical protein EMIHUDRAFT_211256 [Emiliania huxleyi CCMP1516]EOD15684.1 hypothetical protein EMIHUDRAFT_211256 [Emiliania huxleyi CCMP1516]|eukprot:XP_005768113.1 hypothetical protein EMIHUDRAFT_211256 [Emiliania huxleyi CCMP1516]
MCHHYANYSVTEKSVSHGIQPKPPQVRAGPKTAVLPESYNVEKVISWRQRAGGIELLIAWEGDDVDGWTWDPLDNIPERFVRAFHAQRQRLPPSFFYVVTMMRDRIGFKLLERTGPMFGVAVLAHELVVHAKKTLKQPWAAEPVWHRLRASGWCDQLVPL